MKEENTQNCDYNFYDLLHKMVEQIETSLAELSMPMLVGPDFMLAVLCLFVC